MAAGFITLQYRLKNVSPFLLRQKYNSRSLLENFSSILSKISISFNKFGLPLKKLKNRY